MRYANRPQPCMSINNGEAPLCPCVLIQQSPRVRPQHEIFPRQSIGQDRPHKIGVVDLAIFSNLDGLEELVHLLATHLLPQILKNIPQLSNADDARAVLVEDLKAATVFLRLARIAEPAGPIQNALESLEVEVGSRER